MECCYYIWQLLHDSTNVITCYLIKHPSKSSCYYWRNSYQRLIWWYYITIGHLNPLVLIKNKNWWIMSLLDIVWLFYFIVLVLILTAIIQNLNLSKHESACDYQFIDYIVIYYFLLSLNMKIGCRQVSDCNKRTCDALEQNIFYLTNLYLGCSHFAWFQKPIRRHHMLWFGEDSWFCHLVGICEKFILHHFNWSQKVIWRLMISWSCEMNRLCHLICFKKMIWFGQI